MTQRTAPNLHTAT